MRTIALFLVLIMVSATIPNSASGSTIQRLTQRIQNLRAKKKASTVLDQANQQSNVIVEEARVVAKKEADKILSASNQQVQQEINAAKDKLRKDVAKLSVQCAEKIINKEIDEKKHSEIFSESLKRF